MPLINEQGRFGSRDTTEFINTIQDFIWCGVDNQVHLYYHNNG